MRTQILFLLLCGFTSGANAQYYYEFWQPTYYVETEQPYCYTAPSAYSYQQQSFEYLQSLGCDTCGNTTDTVKMVYEWDDRGFYKCKPVRQQAEPLSAGAPGQYIAKGSLAVNQLPQKPPQQNLVLLSLVQEAVAGSKSLFLQRACLEQNSIVIFFNFQDHDSGQVEAQLVGNTLQLVVTTFPAYISQDMNYRLATAKAEDALADIRKSLQTLLEARQ